MELIISIAGIIFVFYLVVFAHELGHFIMARRSGVKVEEFAFGIPPRIWSIQKGETRYSINLLPLGGYVRLHGEDGSDKKSARSFASKSARVRASILLAGVVLNFALAWLILFGSYLFGMKPILPEMANHKGVKNNMIIEVNEVKEDTPADKADIKKGDVIKKINGSDVRTYEEMRVLVETKSEENGSEKLNVLIERDGKTLEKEVGTYKKKEKIGNKEVDQTYLGVGISSKGNISASFFVAARASFEEVVRIIGLTFQSVGELFKKIIFSFQVPDNVAGPVGIFVITGSFAQVGFSALLQFAAIFSVAVGVFNLIPIPALDGGHVFILALESILKRKFSDKAKSIAQFAGFSALIILMIVVTFKDVFTFGIIK